VREEVRAKCFGQMFPDERAMRNYRALQAAAVTARRGYHSAQHTAGRGLLPGQIQLTTEGGGRKAPVVNASTKSLQGQFFHGRRTRESAATPACCSGAQD